LQEIKFITCLEFLSTYSPPPPPPKNGTYIVSFGEGTQVYKGIRCDVDVKVSERGHKKLPL